MIVNVADRMWSMANLVVVFSAGQTVAFLYSLAQPELAQQLAPLRIAIWAVVGACLFALTYGFIVWWCWSQEIRWHRRQEADRATHEQYRDLSRCVFVGRIAALAIFAALSSFLTLLAGGHLG